LALGVRTSLKAKLAKGKGGGDVPKGRATRKERSLAEKGGREKGLFNAKTTHGRCAEQGRLKGTKGNRKKETKYKSNQLLLSMSKIGRR